MARQGLSRRHGRSCRRRGEVITADFAFDVPARFDADQMDITIETYELGRWGEIPIVEIRT
jgi:uncharacterized protein (TIGR02217 family)